MDHNYLAYEQTNLDRLFEECGCWSWRLSIKEYPENMNNLTWKDDWKNVVAEAED